MKNKVKFFSPTMFGLIIIFFFLPFVTFSCKGNNISTFTGIQLVNGVTIEEPTNIFNNTSSERKIESNILLCLIFAFIIIGFSLSFLKGRKAFISSIIIGGVCLILLLFFKFNMDNSVLKNGEGMISVEYGIGFWLSFLFLLLIIIGNIFFLTNDNKSQQVVEEKNKPI